MKKIPLQLFIGLFPLLSLLSCANAQVKPAPEKQKSTLPPSAEVITSRPGESFTDERDGALYTTVIIGAQTWMAENLRFEIEGSMQHPDIPAKEYGRLYFLDAAMKACPKGWHLPMDREWDQLELAHGMPESFIDKGGWRGEHAVNLKSTSEWGEDGSGKNSLGFNVRPAGYYFSEEVGMEVSGLEGLGFSAAFWATSKTGAGVARFMFSPRLFVNKWTDANPGTTSALSCRCIKD